MTLGKSSYSIGTAIECNSLQSNSSIDILAMELLTIHTTNLLSDHGVNNPKDHGVNNPKDHCSQFSKPSDHCSAIYTLLIHSKLTKLTAAGKLACNCLTRLLEYGKQTDMTSG